MKRGVREELFNILLIAGGLLLATLGYRLYLIPNNVAPGGFTGVGQIVNHLLPVVGVGMVNLILNVPLFLLSLRSMGLGFGLRSLLASVTLSFLLDYLPVPAMTTTYCSPPSLAAFCAARASGWCCAATPPPAARICWRRSCIAMCRR